jgi:hypothetical protein
MYLVLSLCIRPLVCVIVRVVRHVVYIVIYICLFRNTHYAGCRWRVNDIHKYCGGAGLNPWYTRTVIWLTCPCYAAQAIIKNEIRKGNLNSSNVHVTRSM